jgi:hypothetical protein
MAQNPQHHRQYQPTVISQQEGFPNFTFLVCGEFSEENPNKKHSNGKEKKYLQYR